MGTGETVRYVVGLSRAPQQIVDVEMEIPTEGRSAVEVSLPVWRPGRYEVLDQAGTVRAAAAFSPAGEELAMVKTAKSTWRITTGGHERVTMRYSIYANALNNRTRHADDTHAFLSGAAIFMMGEHLRGAPHEVTVRAPASWRTATGLEPLGDGRFRARDYDVLVDSPLEVGEHELIEFEVDGVPHEIAIWGEGAYEPRTLIKDFSAIVRAQLAIFGSFPYDRYVFLVHIAPGAGGGTEHLNSTIMQTSPAAFESASRYRGFLGLVSHEFFHTWNVKAFRPSGIHPYDYLAENYTDLLWVAEGTTSYYDDLVLARTGHMRVDDYLGSIASNWESLQKRPGRKVQSLAESSFDAWIKFNRPNPDTHNTTVDFYSQGALASLALDMLVREATRNRASLDDVMRLLYERYPLSGPGYDTQGLLTVVRDVAGRDFAAFIDAHIRGTEPLPLAKALLAAGLELTTEPVGDSGARRAYVGLQVSDKNGMATVDSVLEDGPAFGAGVIAGDEIVAMNGQRLRAADLDARLKKLVPGDRVELTALRRDQLRTFVFHCDGRDDARWIVRKIDEPTDLQALTFESWIGQPWNGKEFRVKPGETP